MDATTPAEPGGDSESAGVDTQQSVPLSVIVQDP
jgi:hypothetical protein